ncbi:MAG: serine hydrolase [Alphaproteobacteria bacterium]|nr:serine hydrolase [Alphaproteobacteria bacterium]
MIRFAATSPICGLVLLALMAAPGTRALADHRSSQDGAYFVLEGGLDLRDFADAPTRALLERIKGEGEAFTAEDKAHYCRLKGNAVEIQWVVNNLDTGEVIARSANAEVLYFGASVSKVFVAAALLDKQKGKFTRTQLRQLAKMIVVSDNPAWRDLQRQVGEDGSDDSGRAAVHAFVRRMGYPTIMGFQGWRTRKDGVREHGNELNTLELARFLYDTYQRKYPGAEALWKIMQATRTGSRKIGKFTPANVYIGGKTGTYSGPNSSPKTVRLATIESRNHAAVLMVGDSHYGLSILANTGSSEDVAVLGGGLMREYLGVAERVDCG